MAKSTDAGRYINKMNLEKLFLHDSLIKSIMENPKTDELIFNIDYPEDWENHIFINANLVFENVLNYEVHEGPFAGNQTILDVNAKELNID